jgi:hypothetical protein
MDLRQVAEKDPNYPAVLFFYQGTIADGNTFFMRLWPGAVAVADPSLTFYKAFGVPRGGLKEMFAPQVWTCGLRAARKGHMIGRPVGDSWIMPGLFLVSDTGRILRRHDFAHAGDHPDFAAFPLRAE